MLNFLRNHKEYITIDANKNLGGCLLKRELYTCRAITNHLGDQRIYKRLTKHQGNQLQHILQYKLNLWLSKHCKKVAENELVFLKRALKQFPTKLTRFRLTAKVQKTPWKTRPIFACCGTFRNYILESLARLPPPEAQNLRPHPRPRHLPPPRSPTPHL